MKRLLLAAALGFGALLALDHAPAEARFGPGGVAAPSLVEDAQCRVRQVRTVRPNGRVVYRTVRDCRPRYTRRCRTVRERVIRPNGRVVIRDVRRCR